MVEVAVRTEVPTVPLRTAGTTTRTFTVRVRPAPRVTWEGPTMEPQPERERSKVSV